jgi:hypothetical protein
MAGRESLFLVLSGILGGEKDLGSRWLGALENSPRAAKFVERRDRRGVLASFFERISWVK